MTNQHNCGESGKRGMSVTVRNGDVDKALQIFKKMVLEEGLMKELKSREGFEKPSLKKKRKKAEAIRRAKKETSLRIRHEGF
jgi:small subunit ribosomal protein S21